MRILSFEALLQNFVFFYGHTEFIKIYMILVAFKISDRWVLHCVIKGINASLLSLGSSPKLDLIGVLGFRINLIVGCVVFVTTWFSSQTMSKIKYLQVELHCN